MGTGDSQVSNPPSDRALCRRCQERLRRLYSDAISPRRPNSKSLTCGLGLSCFAMTTSKRQLREEGVTRRAQSSKQLGDDHALIHEVFKPKILPCLPANISVAHSAWVLHPTSVITAMAESRRNVLPVLGGKLSSPMNMLVPTGMFGVPAPTVEDIACSSVSTVRLFLDRPCESPATPPPDLHSPRSLLSPPQRSSCQRKR